MGSKLPWLIVNIATLCPAAAASNSSDSALCCHPTLPLSPCMNYNLRGRHVRMRVPRNPDKHSHGFYGTLRPQTAEPPHLLSPDQELPVVHPRTCSRKTIVYLLVILHFLLHLSSQKIPKCFANKIPRIFTYFKIKLWFLTFSLSHTPHVCLSSPNPFLLEFYHPSLPNT